MDANAVFSRLVLKGLETKGVLRTQIARITGLSALKIRGISEEKASFSKNQLQALETATGMTDSSLALLATPDADADFIALISALDNGRHVDSGLAEHGSGVDHV